MHASDSQYSSRQSAQRASKAPTVPVSGDAPGSAAGSPTAAGTRSRSFLADASSASADAQPLYHRLVVEGDEADGGDFVKCAELIASLLDARRAYKSADKGQREAPLTFAEVSALGLVAPADETARSEQSTPGAAEVAVPAVGPADGESAAAAGAPSAETASTASPLALRFDGGVYQVQGTNTTLVPWSTYVADIKKVYQAIESGPCLSTARSRLIALAGKFELYSLMNSEQEVSRKGRHGGVYARCTKVDNALRLKTCVPAPVLLDFIVRAAKERPRTPLFFLPETRKEEDFGASTHTDAPSRVGSGGRHRGKRKGRARRGPETIRLRQFVQSAGRLSDPSKLTVEGLGLQPTLYRNKFLPYDMLDGQLNPAGPFVAKLLQAILSTDNDGPDHGDLCGALIRTELEKRELRSRQSVVTEMLLEVSGASEREVPSLAAWVRRQGFNRFSSNLWVLSITPRVKHPPTGLAARDEEKGYGVSGAQAVRMLAGTITATVEPTCRTVGDQLRNLFYPLFMATLYPTDPRWSDVAQLLLHTSAVNIQTEATSRKQNLFSDPVHPDAIRADHRRGGATAGSAGSNTTTGGGGSAGGAAGKEVSDFYFFYYTWANVASLNSLRARFGLNTLNFSPSVREQAPAYDQLVCSFLLADNVFYATSLERCWILQYLYLYSRIGVVLLPLSDNVMTMPYMDHPAVKFFRKGMRVSLSTGDPLHFHHRVDQPLLEEYATLMKLRSLSTMDMCELARNSVLNSGFPEERRREWLGDNYAPIGCTGNEPDRSGVCDARLEFRHECLREEEAALNRVLAKVAASARGGKGGPPKVITLLAEAAMPAALRGTVGGDDGPLPTGFFFRNTGAARLAAGGAVRARSLSERAGIAGRSRSLTPAEAAARASERNYVDPSMKFSRIRIVFGDGRGGAGQERGAGKDAPYTASVSRATVMMLRQVLLLRRRYTHLHVTDAKVEDVFSATNRFAEEEWEYSCYYGVVLLSRVGKSPEWPSTVPPLQEFIRDLDVVREAASSASLRRLASHRLRLLERRFQLHLSMNISREGGTKEEKEWNNRDFFTAHKVDTNVQMEAGHNARTLVEFVVDKALNHGDDVVGEDAAQNPITLKTLLQHYNVRVETITVDELHHLLHTHEDLRRTFLSPDNYMQGRYFAEMTKKTLSLYQEDAYSFAENRLTLHGASQGEWQQLSHWFDRYGMASSQSRWMVSVPRQYDRLWRDGAVKNFGEFLENLFLPLWDISLHPARDTRLHYFLAHVSGFDCADAEESSVDPPMMNVHPHEWRTETNPGYNYYMYYLWANISTLNAFRASRGLSTFTFRPQCGEQGSLDHLIGGFLLANGINHGVTLAKHPVLEYMFYLAQIGIAMSPLSNTAAASAYLENPFPKYFQRGLHVSLATNTPLYFHFTREPLIEEYSIASKLWQLEFNDLSEIARNSVLQCGFPPAWKAMALGPLYDLRSTLGNDVRRSHVADIRVAFRYESYHGELSFLDEQLAVYAGTVVASSAGDAPSPTLSPPLESAPPERPASALSPLSRGHSPRPLSPSSPVLSRHTPSPSPSAQPQAQAQQLRMPRAMRTLREERAIHRAVTASLPSPQKRKSALTTERAAANGAALGADAGATAAAAAAAGESEDAPRAAGIPSAQVLAMLLSRGAEDDLDNAASTGDHSSEDDEDDDDEYGSHSGSGSSDDDADDREDGSAAIVRRRCRQHRRDLRALEEEVQRLSALAEQLTLENGAVATMTGRLRRRLQSEGFAILGGLTSSKPT